MVLAIVLGLSTLAEPRDAITESEWRRRGLETLNLMEQRFIDAQRGRWSDALTLKSRSERPAFLWGMSVLLSSYVACEAVEPKVGRPRVEQWLNRTLDYWALHRGVGGYAVWPNQSPPDRYYDDNAWVALALAESVEATGSRDHLRRAIQLFEFLQSGEDEQLGGGIWWREREKDGKNTCINAPAALVALKLYRTTQERRFLEAANRWLVWLDRLQDSDGLFFDHVRSDGAIEQFKWSYNSALPIRAYAERFRQLKQPGDRQKALEIARAARKKWVDPATGAIRDEASFAHHLLEGFLAAHELEPDGGWRKVAEHAADWLYTHGRSAEGLYGKSWDKPPPGGETEVALLWQASAARAFWVLSKAKSKPPGD